MSEPQNQDQKVGTDQPPVGATTTTAEQDSPEPQDQEEKIGAGQSTAGGVTAADAEYKVGRGRPPKQYQWPKGRSGNPSGRPRKQLDQKATCERIMNEAVVIRSQDGKERKVPKYDALMRSHFTKAIKGDTPSAKFVRGEIIRLGIEQDGVASVSLPPQTKPAQSNALFANLDLNLLSDEDQAELARLGNVIDLGGDFTALSASDFERIKQITDKGRGKDVTPAVRA